MGDWPAEISERSSCAGLLVLASSSRDPDLAAFVGSAHLGESFVIWPAGRAPRLGYLTSMERDEAAATGLDLLTPQDLDIAALRDEIGSGESFWAAVLTRAFQILELPPGELMVAGRPPLGSSYAALEHLVSAGWSFTDGTAAMRRHRRRKGEAEIGAARVAAQGACRALERVAALLARAEVTDSTLVADGDVLTVGRCRREINAAMAASGLEQPEGNIVAAAGDAAVPHSRGADERVLRPGETLVVDVFPRLHLFADCTRTFVVGSPPAEITAAHRTVLAALEAARAAICPGKRGWELQELVCEKIGAAGYETPITHPGTERGYVHGLGHGVGLELHEYPSFARRAEAEGRIEAGDLLTLEPGLYDPQSGWGIRLEDLCLVTVDGVENLTPLPYDMDPKRWQEAGPEGPEE